MLGRACRSAEALHMPAVELWLELGRLEHAARRYPAARVAWQNALDEVPQFLPALLGAGNAALLDGDFAAAETHFRSALALDASLPAAWSGLAQSEAGMRRFDDAQAALQRMFALAPPDRAAFAAAAWIALQTRDWASAVRHCSEGLAGAPRDATLLGLLGQARKSAGAPVDARRAFEAAVAADPDDPSARIGLGAALLDLGLADEARMQLEAALAMGATTAEGFANLGLAWLARDDHERAAAMFARAVAANPKLTPAFGDLVWSRRCLCEWEGLEALESRLVATLDDPDADPRLSPFVTLALNVSPGRQLVAARRWSQSMLAPASAPALVRTRGDRLRIGYFSNEFRDHATGRLLAGLIEAHDRGGVEVFGYGYGAADDSALRRRLVAGFDHWRDLHFMSDAGIERSIRADRIDVLLDLKGHTRGGRLSALAERPATVQLHFMGYPGTLGFDAIDGLVADEIVIPRGDEGHFHERIFRLPRCYLASDAARRLPGRAQRAAHGLPDDALVIGSLNQSYKFTRDVFDAWMEALRSAPRSVLWLFASHPRVAVNLRAAAARLGVAGERLIFATRTPQDGHIARVRCMDLALDTLPYGSHTTGIDALWAGVPMLTCRGPTFAGRVGASLLTAAELPELIASDPDDYRRRLVGLAGAPAILREYAAHLDRRRSTLPLWDTRGFAGDFERLLAHAYDAVVAAR